MPDQTRGRYCRFKHALIRSSARSQARCAVVWR